jgi:hypothetical protein
MVTTTKYKAKHVYWDLENRTVKSTFELERYRQKNKLALPEHIVRFDSQHEFRVYLELCRIYGTERVVRQHRIRIVPPCYCYPNGKFWRVDFAIKYTASIDGYQLYCEAKGLVTREFEYTLTLLEQNRPLDFVLLHLVFPDTIPKQNKLISTLAKDSFCNQMYTFKDLARLPNYR